MRPTRPTAGKPASRIVLPGILLILVGALGANAASAQANESGIAALSVVADGLRALSILGMVLAIVGGIRGSGPVAWLGLGCGTFPLVLAVAGIVIGSRMGPAKAPAKATCTLRPGSWTGDGSVADKFGATSYVGFRLVIDEAAEGSATGILGFGPGGRDHQLRVAGACTADRWEFELGNVVAGDPLALGLPPRFSLTPRHGKNVDAIEIRTADKRLTLFGRADAPIQ